MKNRFSHLVAVVALSFSIGIPWLSAAPAGEKAQIEKVVASPNDKISLVFCLTDGTPSYAVNFKERPVILSSALGFELKGGAMKTGFTLLDAQKSSKDETWTQPWGEQREVVCKRDRAGRRPGTGQFGVSRYNHSGIYSVEKLQ